MDSLLLTLGPAVATTATFLAVILAALSLYLFRMYRAEQLRKRLSQIQSFQVESKGKESIEEGVFQVHWLKPVGELIAPDEEWRRSEIKKLLVQAGFRSQLSIFVYLGSKLVVAAAGIGLVILSYILAGNFFLLVTPQAILYMILAAGFGFFFPDFVLHRIIAVRRLDVLEGFPDALDLLVVCVEAGLGLDSSIDRVAKEIRLSHRHLSSELGLIPLEIRAGKTRKEALQGLSDRTEVEQVRSLVTILVQAEQFGTSIGSALRGYAEEMRTDRIQRAREKAARLPVRLIFPVVFCIFPALFLVVLGPAVIQIFTTLSEVF